MARFYVCPNCPYEHGTLSMSCSVCPQRPKPPEDKPTQVNVTISFDKSDIDSIVRQVIKRLKEEGIQQGR